MDCGIFVYVYKTGKDYYYSYIILSITVTDE